MAGDGGAVLAHQARRKIREHIVGGARIVGQVARHQRVDQRVLGQRQQHAQFRPRQIRAGLGARRHGLVVGQELDRAVELLAPLQIAHQPHIGLEPLALRGLGQGQRLALRVIVRQHQRRDLVGQAVQHLVPLRLRRACRRAISGVERDLDVDLVVGGVDAGGIVDRIGVDAAALERIFDAAQLRHAEIGAFADHRRANVARR